ADEVFFLAPMHFVNFAEFAHKVIGVTHTDHQLSDAVYEQVKEAFEQKIEQKPGAAGGVTFEMPMRVDLLLKPE
ncbi:MAG: SAM-dependent methyltransferase, partial [Gallionellaceae bacterium]